MSRGAYGRLVLGCGAVAWAGSAFAIGMCLWLGAEEEARARRLRPMAGPGLFGEMTAGGAVWAVVCAALQVGAVLLLAAGIRRVWRPRSAVCFAVASVGVMAADGVGLLGILVWLRMSLGTS